VFESPYPVQTFRQVGATRYVFRRALYIFWHDAILMTFGFDRIFPIQFDVGRVFLTSGFSLAEICSLTAACSVSLF
jgi:hypothetical protein